ncbi:DEAD/DEAH box helicase [Oceanobacillus halotolerans]|uniref:DEAD/DEAH box helicase n=1 Tax=Oceanobacillus halotolerans TaxID=2663380 RepID=UPI0013DBAB6D|nr:DEAD/DEAH box helicase [Oceanobacillus halotolerans]
MTNNQFEQFSFQSHIMDVIKKLEFHKPTDIQNQIIPAILKGESVIGQSHTGSGKTHAYLLPLFDNLNSSRREVQFVITAPTRELAMQIYDEVKKIIQFAGKGNEWKAKLLVGGTDKQKMTEKLKQPPHIVVGTPGRILDMVKEDVLSIYTAKSFVVDEADLMLDMGFIEDIDQLLIRCRTDIQLHVFSATIPQRLEHFFRKYLENPYHVKIDDQLSPETMEHRLIPVRHREIADIIMEITKAIHPYLAIIFTNGKEQANQLTDQLLQKGLDVGIIHGGLSPRERKRALKDIQQLRYQYIVATDLAARGIDIKGVSHVINAQLPKEEDFYIHRVGRTARAGMEGTAVSLYQDTDLPLIEKLEKKGLSFTFYDVKKGEWVVSKPYNERKMRTKVSTNVDREAWKRVKKKKKVKPGYKKKMKRQQETIKKQMIKKNKYKK